ncbi:MAG: hypothetical protein HQL52_16155 [Magnetococcales bacterium]|nr:hypothetical protein [Magnetococcales bacterium]
MADFLVITPLRRDGTLHPSGTVIEMDPTQAAELLATGVLKAPPVRAAEGSDHTAETPVSAAISRLDPDNPSHWTRDGKPRIEALSAILGRSVSGGERNKAWRRR